MLQTHRDGSRHHEDPVRGPRACVSSDIWIYERIELEGETQES